MSQDAEKLQKRVEILQLERSQVAGLKEDLEKQQTLTEELRSEAQVLQEIIGCYRANLNVTRNSIRALSDFMKKSGDAGIAKNEPMDQEMNLDFLKAGLMATSQELAGVIQAARDELVNKDVQVSEANKRANDLEEKINASEANAEANAEAFRDKLEEAERDLAEVKEQHQALLASLESAQVDLETARQDKAHLENQILEKTDQVSGLEFSVTELKASLECTQLELEAAKANLSEVSTQKNLLEENLRQAQQEIER